MAREIKLGKVVGSDGREVQLRNRDGVIEWKYNTDEAWSVLISLAGIGSGGSDGQSVAFRNNGTAIQISCDKGVTWTDLVSIADITGTDGKDGADGEKGSNGSDGKSVELRVESGYLQWRQSGGVWTNLTELSCLTRRKGF